MTTSPIDCTNCSAERREHGTCACVEAAAVATAAERRKLLGTATPYPVVGVLTPVVWVQMVLGLNHSDYEHYTTGTVHGLAKVRRNGIRLDLLVIASEVPGQGDGGRFLDACTRSYSTVAVWLITSPRLQGMLERRGFRKVREYDGGEMVDGMRWDVTRALGVPS